MFSESDDKWIGIEEAAFYLDVNKDSIRKWLKKRKWDTRSQNWKAMEI